MIFFERLVINTVESCQNHLKEIKKNLDLGIYNYFLNAISLRKNFKMFLDDFFYENIIRKKRLFSY